MQPLHQISVKQSAFNGDDSSAILKEQTDLLYKAIPISLTASLLNALILAGLLFQSANRSLLYSWISFAMFVTVFRALVWNAHRKYAELSREPIVWVKLFNLGVVLAGLSWALPSIFLFHELDIVHQTFLAFVVAGISAGSVSSLAYLRFPSHAFLSLLLIPLAIRYFLLGNLVALAMGFMTSLFYVFNLRSVSSFYNNTKQNIKLRLDAIQKEKSLRESEDNSRTLVNSVPVGVFHYDKNGEITNCNATLVTMLGKPAEQIIGRKLIDQESEGDEFSLALNNSLEGKNGYFLGKTRVLDVQGNCKIRAIMRGLRDANDKINGGVCVVEDLSDEERLDRMKNEFVSVVSHELRTPLTAIIGSLRLINSGTISFDDSRSHQMIDMALSNSNRLFSLINDLLDVHKLDQQKISFDDKEIDLLALAGDAISHNKVLEVSHNIHICLDQSSEMAYIKGDRHRLLQAINNLISNAAKFSPSNGLILIRVGKHGDHALLTIRDNGPGIAQAYHDKIFEKFFQIDSSTKRKFEGTGLGLSITKSIIKQHNGMIKLQSQEGCGTTFIIELPLCNPMQQAS